MFMKSIINVNELAEYLQVSKDTIYTLVRENQIPYKRIRRRIIFHSEVIEEWLRNK